MEPSRDRTGGACPNESCGDTATPHVHSEVRRHRSNTVLPPPPAHEVAAYQETRAEKAQLEHEEMVVSYWRRVVYARLDLVHKLFPHLDEYATSPEKFGTHPEETPGEFLPTLTEALTWVQDSQQHPLPSNAHEILADSTEVPIAELSHFWEDRVPQTYTDATRYMTTLTDLAIRLTVKRSQLHDRLDALHHKNLEQYRRYPALAFTLLPTHADVRSPWVQTLVP